MLVRLFSVFACASSPPPPTCRRAPRGQNAELASAAHAEVELLFRSVSRGDSDAKVGRRRGGGGRLQKSDIIYTSATLQILL